MNRRKKDKPMVFTESGPTEWTDEAIRAFNDGMRILARMIAADIIKKRAAANNQKLDTSSKELNSHDTAEKLSVPAVKPKSMPCNPCRQKPHKYELPAFLIGVLEQAGYAKWLQGRAMAHVRRDKKRGNTMATVAEYKTAIHAAVCRSAGKDAYTGEALDWSSLGTWNNSLSEKGRREYKAKFAQLPTVDHVGDGTGPADFKICAWRTNDAKSDMKADEFIALCRKVAKANG
ncbi:MAG: hypothetical protein GX410_07035 [Elusimicrobia bacterium]|nr:hypothetical protein [Elusimicrobiota bacterium]